MGTSPAEGSTWVETSCFLFFSYFMSSTLRTRKVQEQTTLIRKLDFLLRTMGTCDEFLKRINMIRKPFFKSPPGPCLKNGFEREGLPRRQCEQTFRL